MDRDLGSTSFDWPRNFFSSCDSRLESASRDHPVFLRALRELHAKNTKKRARWWRDLPNFQIGESVNRPFPERNAALLPPSSLLPRKRKQEGYKKREEEREKRNQAVSLVSIRWKTIVGNDTRTIRERDDGTIERHRASSGDYSSPSRAISWFRLRSICENFHSPHARTKRRRGVI